MPFEEIRIAPKPMAPAPTTTTPAVASALPVTPAPPSRQMEKYKKREKEKKLRETAVVPVSPRAPAVARPDQVMIYTPSVNLPFNEQEGLYFHLFQEQTANELSGFFDNIFWSRGVLQECFSETAIRHAVVALGALYKTLEKTCESPPGSPTDSNDSYMIDTPIRHWKMACEKYSHACNELSAQGSQITDRTRLMGSVLLACFDSFIGDHRQAICQIQNGLGLLEQLRAERRRAFLPKPEEPVEEELIQMFTRLAIQAKSYDMAFHFPHPYVICLNGPPRSGDSTSPTSDGSSPVSLHHDPIPERFLSSREARQSWDALVERIFRFTEMMFSYVSNGPMGVLPSSLRRHGISFKDQIQDWSNAYEHILASRTAPGISSQEKAAIAALKMAQIMSQVLFLMTFSDSETQFDAFNPQFKAIVDLALEVVGDEERRAAAKRCPDRQFCQHPFDHWTDLFGEHEYAARHIKPSFSADLGIVPPLFVVATKCRDHVLRRQAIQLLKSSSRREGMWDSELAARIGVWIAGIEEGEDIMTMGESPLTDRSRPSTSSNGSVDFGDDTPLGPGGNARYDVRRGSLAAGHMAMARVPRKAVPAEQRVMIKAVEFDLRERFATIQLGTRGLPTGAPDLKTRVKRLIW